jgi:hypothetical protein
MNSISESTKYIKPYITRSGFLYRKGNREIARVPFATLEVQHAEDVTEDEKFELEFLTCVNVAGEIYKLPKQLGGATIVLGPAREFTHEVTLHACGNPDMRQYADIAPKMTVKVVGIEEATAAVMAYQRTNDMGGGNCARDHGIVWELKESGKRKKVGEVSYNGRYWTLAERKTWEAEMKIKYAVSP